MVITAMRAHTLVGKPALKVKMISLLTKSVVLLNPVLLFCNKMTKTNEMTISATAAKLFVTVDNVVRSARSRSELNFIASTV